MRVAALDLGSNTFLCLIAEVAEGEVIHEIEDQVQIVRLGQGVLESKSFHPEALSRADQCLGQFAELIKQHKVDCILAMATAAARDVRNKEALFELGKKHGIPIQIISGQQEAELTYLGAVANQAGDQSKLIVDIGGGSTELIRGRGNKIEWAQSLPLGCVRLTEGFLPQQPASSQQLESLQNHIRQELSKWITEIEQVDELIAVAGTPTELVRIELKGFDPVRINGYQLDLSHLTKRFDQFASRSPRAIVDELGVQKGRADLILVGTLILRECCELAGLKSVTVSTRGVRYGMASRAEELCKSQVLK